MGIMNRLTPNELEDVAADEWLDYDIRIEAQAEIYRRAASARREEKCRNPRPMTE